MRKKNLNSTNKDQAIGRSAGGLSTKIHATCDSKGKPTGFYLTGGQRHDLNGADFLIHNLTKAKNVLADRAYNSDARVIKKLKKNDVNIVIPGKRNARKIRIYDKFLYKSRHLIENFFLKLKQYRGIATRYDKTKENFLGAIYLIASVIWLS